MEPMPSEKAEILSHRGTETEEVVRLRLIFQRRTGAL